MAKKKVSQKRLTVKQNPPAERRARRRADTEFHKTRSKAMNSYAQLEQNMAFFFGTLIGGNRQKTFIAFSAIINARARWLMLAKLLRLVHGDKYKEFFPFYYKQAQELDPIRNKIVHWLIVGQTRGEEPFDRKQDVFLAEHPNLFGKNKLFLDDIKAFAHKVEFYGALLTQFDLFLLNPNLPCDPSKTPWPEIFQSKPVYPPPLGHPLDRFYKKP